jgi:hypothetical protein
VSFIRLICFNCNLNQEAKIYTTSLIYAKLWKSKPSINPLQTNRTQMDAVFHSAGISMLCLGLGFLGMTNNEDK